MEGGDRRHADLRGRPGAGRGGRHHADAGRAPLGPDRPRRAAAGAGAARRAPRPTRPGSVRSTCCGCRPAIRPTARRRSSWSPPIRHRPTRHRPTASIDQAPIDRTGSARCSTACPTSASRRSRSPPSSSASCATTSAAGWLDAVPRPGRARRLPGRRHGPRQDGDDARPPDRAARSAPRDLPAQRGAQLGGRVASLHPGPDGGRASRMPARQQGEPALFGLGDADIVITTYGLLPRDLERARRAIDWTTVVLDEAQMVKNPSTKAAKAVRKLPRRAEARPHRHAGREPAERAVVDPRRRATPGCSAARQRFREQFATADRAPQRPRGRRPACGSSRSRSCCVAPRPTDGCSPICPTRSSRSPTPSSPRSRRRSTRRSSTSCSSTPRSRRACSAAGGCWPR